MRKKNSSLKILLIFLGLLVVLLLGVRAFYNSLLSPVDQNNQELKLFVIPPGQSSSEIADNLGKSGLIKSPFAFKYLAKTSGLGEKIQAGDFKLSPSMSAEEILKELTVGVVDKWVTLIEGWRIEEMARELSAKLKVQSVKFVGSARKDEGYLFPDTYLLNPDMTEEDVIGILKTNFEKKFTDELRAKIRSQGLTEGEGVILASIVEREGRSDEVRVEVASILLKRLNIGMKLDADATVQYAKDTAEYKTNKNLKFWEPIAQVDYQEVRSNYNTYLHRGLPPGPICNPSLSALEAVAEAHDTNYLYYFHNSKGESFYAEDLETHNQNVAAHR